MRIDIRPELIMTAGMLILTFSLVAYALVLRHLAHLSGLVAHWRMMVAAAAVLLLASVVRLTQVGFSTRQVVASPLDLAASIHRFGALEALLIFLSGVFSLLVGGLFLGRLRR
ncbi:hypothetical protein AMJ39_00465 [candidate division TA06 bacterium DG_24]|uniref:Uncharacterized protein n=2 Tax=Bacteria division TA06 TaxID=1156500 RepID=A0A0S8JK41_UNCT6|nr:MAG: hypothetical protein AMJ39_00465 [candidate division TA06 bacterium DG_24]KPL09180.1 MAG: hypothetical protein AMJ71_07090 [candidate division TA06 bacterium SM1_40]